MGIEELRNDLQNSNTVSMRCRRAIIAASLAGMGAMEAVALRQTGMIKRLPELPAEGFDAEQVVLSDTAYALGVPDGTLSLASLAANIPIAAAGPAERAAWLPIAAAAKAGIESLVSLWYMRREKRWCSYCLVAAAANLTIFALTLPEARTAFKSSR